MQRVFASADAAMRGALSEVIEAGEVTSPRGKRTKEITSFSMVIRDPRDRICGSRTGLRRGYPAALLAWNLARRNDVAGLEPWNPSAKLFSDDEVTVQGENYGERMWPSLTGALHVLRDDPQSRRAWVSVWMPGREYGGNAGMVGLPHQTKYALVSEDMPVVKSSNVPCCIGFGLRIVQRKLVMQVVMRSQSLWGVFPYDVFLFTVLQELIANELGVELGWYEHNMLSAHVYDHEVKWFEQSKPVDTSSMEPIAKTLSAAAEKWPTALADLNGEAPKAVAYFEDPIEMLMYTHRPKETA